MKSISVFLVDDSAFVRQLAAELLTREPGIVVAGQAQDPIAAQQKLASVAPDVILLDIEMPHMDGLQFLRVLREAPRTRDIPVLMFSSLTEQGCEHTLRALELGAVDFITKPKLDLRRGFEELAGQLVSKVRAAALSKRPAPCRAPGAPSAARVEPLRSAGVDDREMALIALASSTGGTEALREIFRSLAAGLPPIVIAQHMPERFTQAFAKRLDAIGPVRVAEARDRERLAPGRAYIAPGNQHLEVIKLADGFAARLSGAPAVNGHRPSADVLFRSCAKAAGARAMAAILTGMGKDGAMGLLDMRRAGAHTIAQDEASCVVFGMPREAIEAGAAAAVLPLSAIAQHLAATRRLA